MQPPLNLAGLPLYSVMVIFAKRNRTLMNIRLLLKTHSLVLLILFAALFAQAQINTVNEATLKILEEKVRVNADSCLKVLRKSEPANETLRGYYDFVKGSAFALLGKSDSARYYLKQAENGTKNNQRVQAYICYYFGFIYRIENDLNNAKVFFKKAEALAQPLRNNQLHGLIDVELGGCCDELNMFDSALYYYKRALIYSKQFGDKQMTAIGYNNISIAYFRKGNYEKAIEWQLNAIKAKEGLKDTISLATSLNNVGSMFIRLKKYAQAKRYLSKSFRLLNDESKIAGFSALNLGICFKKMGNLDSALFYYDVALKIYTKLRLESSIGSAYTNIGGVYEAKLNYHKALEYMQKSLEISKRVNNEYDIAIRSRNVANVYLELGQPTKAKTHIFESKKFADKLKSIELSMEVYNTLSKYYEKTNNYVLALANYKIYKDLNDSLFSENSENTINELNTKYETEKKEKEIGDLKNQKKISGLELIRKENSIYQQRLIIYFSAAVLVLISLALYLFFKRYKLKQKNAQELLARQKLELEQRMLLSQMNPHFIFNSLAAVQEYIGISETTKAQSFLSKFARLMRSILQNSRRQFIAIDEEMESLKWYIEIEKQRFGGKFDFELFSEIDEPEFIMIPPMMVQPFVENAIIHGFANKASGGLLKVRYQQIDEMVQVLVEDNGMGRMTIEPNQIKHDKGHVSLGTKVVMERLELLGHELKIKTSCSYEDLKTEQGEPCGTRVRLVLPVKNRDE